MRVHLVNPRNPNVSLSKISRWNKLNKYRVWEPLALLTLARLTPADWQVEVLDENLGPIDYDRLPRPDVVGITAFTSQATRAYEVAAHFKAKRIPVVMGGIHASMCRDEALQHVDAIVTGEAEEVWARLLDDVRDGKLERVYTGGFVETNLIPAAQHDILGGRYFFGSLQTTRGCPLRCNFCSVTSFNGGRFRHRPMENVLDELRQIRDKAVFFVDDNLIGTRQDHIAYSKALFRAMIDEGLTKPWICQATINFADDEELLDLADKSGCRGVFIGFETISLEGLTAVHKKFNVRKGRDLPASVRRIQVHGIAVVGSFIMGIDTDTRGIGEQLAASCEAYGVDAANVLVLTPLPGTSLYEDMAKEDRIIANDYPEDWQYYTLAHPVARYKNFSWAELAEEMNIFHDHFYSYTKIAGRVFRLATKNWFRPSRVIPGTVANLTYRFNQLYDRKVYDARQEEGDTLAAGTEPTLANA
jgi:radical SAM superfamily enzyme YgiQ (UPF0313 family)